MKESRSYSFLSPKNNRQALHGMFLKPHQKTTNRFCMECSWNPNTSVQRCLDPLLQRTLFLSLLTPVFWGYLKPQVRINKMVNSIDYHPYTSRSASKVHHFIFLKTPSGFISLQDACWIFSETFIYSTMCGENFQIYGVHIPRKCIDSRHFYSCCSPLKTLPQVLVIAP